MQPSHIVSILYHTAEANVAGVVIPLLRVTRKRASSACEELLVKPVMVKCSTVCVLKELKDRYPTHPYCLNPV